MRRVRDRLALPSLAFVAVTAASVPALPADPPSPDRAAAADLRTPPGDAVVLHKAADAVFDFEAREIQGSIRLDGPYHGVTRLVDCRSGKQIIDPRYSALNLFKLMAVNQAMGMPRTMDRTIRAGPYWVEAKWAATDAHHGELTARYEVRQPNAVDLTVSVTTSGAYAGYEVFLSSYFDKTLRPYVYLQPGPRGPTAQEADLVQPALSDVFRGTVLVFSRDWHASRRCLDGRWNRDERGTPTVQMCPVRRYAHCLALLADPEKRTGVVLMSDPRQCYAISTRYHADEDRQRLTDYSAFDFSLFGDDLLPRDERTARVRLALVPLDDGMSQVVRLYRTFLSELSAQPPRAVKHGQQEGVQ